MGGNENNRSLDAFTVTTNNVNGDQVARQERNEPTSVLHRKLYYMTKFGFNKHPRDLFYKGMQLGMIKKVGKKSPFLKYIKKYQVTEAVTIVQDM